MTNILFLLLQAGAIPTEHMTALGVLALAVIAFVSSVLPFVQQIVILRLQIRQTKLRSELEALKETVGLRHSQGKDGKDTRLVPTRKLHDMQRASDSEYVDESANTDKSRRNET